MNRTQDKIKENITFPICAVKISTFNPELELPSMIQQRYSGNEKIELRR